MQKSKMQMLGLVVALALVAIGTSELAFADNSTTTTSSNLVFVVFVAAGVTWAFSGFLSNWRTHLDFVKVTTKDKQRNADGTWADGWTGFDITQLRDDIFLGLIIGAIAFFTNATTSIPAITDIQSFGAAVLVAYGLVAITDKTVVGTILNK